MHKIVTLFKRDEDGRHGVIPDWSPDAYKVIAGIGIDYPLVPTEKLDGTNIRLTVRNHQVVRTEKRRNPTKDQKHAGIIDPWYADTSPDDPSDAYLLEAAANVGALSVLPNGEYSAEAIGRKIQGNPLDLDGHQAVVLAAGNGMNGWVHQLRDFTLRLDTTEPADMFDYVRDYLATARSALNHDRPIEGIVWHDLRGRVKIKARDFKGEHAIEWVGETAAAG